MRERLGYPAAWSGIRATRQTQTRSEARRQLASHFRRPRRFQPPVVRETRVPHERYFLASLPLSSRIPTSRSSSSLRARVGFRIAAASSLGADATRAAERTTRFVTRLLVLAIATVLPYRPHGEDVRRLSHTELHVGSFEDPAACPKSWHAFALF